MEGDCKFGYESLDVWQKAIVWASDIITLVECLKTDRKHYRLIEQLEAASTSVAMNIAEGKGRYSKKEFAQFLYISRGSLYETVTLLEIFKKQNWLESNAFQKIKTDATEIAKMLNALINSIKC
ncbi:MAG: four helix bundle protein [Syntrophales bacterium]|nr:four helix bundle protein [Syntrophales bacterium]